MSMTLIEHIEVGAGGAASITFSSIPTDGSFTDLYLVMSLRTTHTGSNWGEVTIKPNNSTSNLTRRTLYGTGSTAGSEFANAWRVWASSADATASTFASASLYIANYIASAAKSVSVDSTSETNATAALQAINAMLWNDTTAISSLVIEAEASKNLVQYSSATLYGITSGNDGVTSVT